MRSFRLPLLLGLYWVIWASSPLVHSAEAKRTDGPIVFESDRGGQSDIWVMDADGTNARKLTDDKGEDVFPAWSPDGKKIAWTRGARGPEGEIWVMNADGSGKQQVTHNAFSDFNPTWSPDGARLAFRSLRGNNRDIYLINLDGTGEARLTNDPASDFAPDWSPDGTRIAFTSLRSGHSAIWVMDANGDNQQQLTADAQEAALPGWSTGGDRIVYNDGFCDVCGESDVFVMNADGTGVTQITNSKENELSKSWSRTDQRVVADFSTLSPSGAHLAKADIAVIDVADGTTVNLTNTSGINEEHPDWSPVSAPQGAEASPNTAGLGARTLRASVSTGTNRGGPSLSYILPGPGHVRLRIFDVQGREVGRPVDKWETAGTHFVAMGTGEPSAVYFYRLEWESQNASGKVLVMH